MKIVIPGGSGQIGALLARVFVARGDEVVILARTPKVYAQKQLKSVAWDGRTLGAWTSEIDGADLVINLAGRTVDCRYSARNMQQMLDSRVDSTRVVGQAIAAATRAPKLWLQASTATIYAHRFDAANDEHTGIIGGNEPGAPAKWNGSIRVATAWEAALNAAETPGTRKVALRSSMTMSPDKGGIFDTLLGLVRKGLGGTCGNGKQFVAWIHEADFIRAIDFLVAREDISGAVNVCSPHPLPNADFMRQLRQAWGTRIGLPAPAPLLAIGAIFLRTETELILKSRRVVPARLSEAGFTFEFPLWSHAAHELCARVRKRC
jgi:uncharacterized protein (TIGR01777 family)